MWSSTIHKGVSFRIIICETCPIFGQIFEGGYISALPRFGSTGTGHVFVNARLGFIFHAEATALIKGVKSVLPFIRFSYSNATMNVQERLAESQFSVKVVVNQRFGPRMKYFVGRFGLITFCLHCRTVCKN